LEYFFVLGVGLIAGTIGGIVGFGSSIMLMPVLVVAFGPRQAVPIMAVAAIMTNLSRIVVWWRDVDWRACAAYSITGAPAAVFGGGRYSCYRPESSRWRSAHSSSQWCRCVV